MDKEIHLEEWRDILDAKEKTKIGTVKINLVYIYSYVRIFKLL